MSRCKSCGAPLRWMLSERGRPMPFDPEPYEGDLPSGLFVVREGRMGVDLAVAVTPDAFPGEPVYRSHFATCPHGATWRK